jgi:hypothetical protein
MRTLRAWCTTFREPPVKQNGRQSGNEAEQGRANVHLCTDRSLFGCHAAPMAMARIMALRHRHRSPWREAFFLPKTRSGNGFARTARPSRALAVSFMLRR